MQKLLSDRLCRNYISKSLNLEVIILKNKLIATMPILIMLCILTGCSSRSQKSSELYYFMDGYLLGSCSDGKFISHNDITSPFNVQKDYQYYINDLLAEEAYHLFKEGKYICSSNKVSFSANYTVETDRSKTYADMLSGVSSRSQSGSPGIVEFSLPINLSKIQKNISVPKYSFCIDFYNESDSVISGNTLATNAPYDITVPGVTVSYENTDSVCSYIINYLAKQNATAIIGDICTISCDMDNDGKEEMIIISNSRVSEDNTAYAAYTPIKSLSVYSVIIYVDSSGSISYPLSSVKNISSGYSPELDNSLVSFQGIYDLNNDGSCELCISKSNSIFGYSMVYALNSLKNLEVVMTASYSSS